MPNSYKLNFHIVERFIFLKQNNLSYVRIGKIYNVNHTTPRYWWLIFKQFGIDEVRKRLEYSGKCGKVVDRTHKKTDNKRKGMMYADYIRKNYSKSKADSIIRHYNLNKNIPTNVVVLSDVINNYGD